MDDEQDDYQEREERAATEMRAESEDRAETEDGERLGRIEEPPAPEELEEPQVYTQEEYQLAKEIKAIRLFREQKDRPPYTSSELSHFLITADFERPVRPDDEDLQAARSRLEAAGS
jgi:hypothetical protein